MRKIWYVSILILFLAGGYIFAQENVRVIVGFKGNPDVQLIQNNNGQVVAHLDGINALTAILPANAVSKVKAHAGVKYVELDAEVTALQGKALGKPAPSQPPQSLPWGIDRVDAELTWGTTTGSGVPVAIIDTGIDYGHPDLKGNVYQGPTYVSGTRSSKDDNGHGTHVSGTVAAVNNTIGVVGAAPTAQLWGVKVLDRNGSGWLSSVISGINWSASNRMKIANLSLGTTSDSQALHDSCDNAVAQGVLLVAAAGNGGNTTPNYPGAYASVVCVSATDTYNNLAYFSTYGSQVDLAAPGVGITSTVKGGGYATWNGTSMATPHVTGSAALVLATNPSLTNSNVRFKLESTAVDLGAAGPDVQFGNGLVNALNAVSAP